MPLIPMELPLGGSPLPRDVRLFVREADRRIERFRLSHTIPAFVPSDFATAYSALRALEAADLLGGRWFCEWGSGFGVVACLAAMLGYEAWGIEVEEALVEEARHLADDFDLPVGFVRGSFIPRTRVIQDRDDASFNWLTTGEENCYDELGLDPADFDVIFAYPWPDEESVTAQLFEESARPGAVLATYHGGEDLTLRRKIRKRKRRA